jgi:hypothetical protein
MLTEVKIYGAKSKLLIHPVMKADTVSRFQCMLRVDRFITPGARGEWEGLVMPSHFFLKLWNL